MAFVPKKTWLNRRKNIKKNDDVTIQYIVSHVLSIENDDSLDFLFQQHLVVLTPFETVR
jgi:hypothetical protein